MKNNLYGAKLNTSQLQEAQPNEGLKRALRLKFLKGSGTLAAGTPTRSRISMNLHQLPQWEKVPEKLWNDTAKIASAKGNYLRLPVYRIKQAKGSNGVNLTSTCNFANREST